MHARTCARRIRGTCVHRTRVRKLTQTRRHEKRKRFHGLMCMPSTHIRMHAHDENTDLSIPVGSDDFVPCAGHNSRSQKRCESGR
jgi:hypothetical protein